MRGRPIGGRTTKGLVQIREGLVNALAGVPSLQLWLLPRYVKKEREPFGAVLVKEGQIVAATSNSVLKSRDCTATAEICRTLRPTAT